MTAATPDARVVVDGTDITPVLFGKVAQPGGRPPRNRLVSLSISEKRGEEADQLDLVIDDSDGAVAIPPDGARISVAIGWRAGTGVTLGLVDKGVFIVDEVSHGGPPDLLSVKARAVDFAGDLKVRREKGWHDTTLGDIVARVAARHGLKPACAATLAGETITAKAQSRESDLAFLRRLGRERNAVATIKRGVLIFKPVGDGLTPTGRQLPTLTIERRDGDAHQFQRQKREEVTGVSATWRDRAGGTAKDVTDGKPEGARKLSRVYGSEAEAQTAAKAAHARAGRQPLSLTLTLALGRPDIHPEQPARLSGYKAVIDEVAWLVAEVTHSLGDRGLTTQLKLDTGAEGESAPEDSATARPG